MAGYEKANLLLRAPATPSQGQPSDWVYGSATDTLATISASGYFALDNDDALSNVAFALQVGDIINVTATDGFAALRVTDVDPAVVTEAAVTSNISITASATVAPGSLLLLPVTTAGGATASITLTMTQAVRVIDFWAINLAAGSASDTIQLKNGSNAISAALDMNVSDAVIVRAASLVTAYRSVAAGGTLVITETDGGGSNSPAMNAYVMVQAV